MKRIALVTDSTADLTPEMMEKLGAHVIPLKFLFGEEEYYDGEMTSEAFYTRLQEERELPKTSQPSPEEFCSLYERLLQDYQEIISIHISSGLSGTLNSARLAKERFKEKIHIIDSKTISLGVVMLLTEAAKYIKDGLDGSAIVEKLNHVRSNVETLFTLNTLEYLQKGGRIGKVQSIMGTFLNIKPIVRVGEDGIYHTYGKARSQEKALKQIVQAFQDLSQGKKVIQFAVAHGAAHHAGMLLKEAMESAFQLPGTIFTQVGPVIGVHTGPGTIGAAVLFES